MRGLDTVYAQLWMQMTTTQPGPGAECQYLSDYQSQREVSVDPRTERTQVASEEGLMAIYYVGKDQVTPQTCGTALEWVLFNSQNRTKMF